MSDRDEHLEALQGMWRELKSMNKRMKRGFLRLETRIDATNERLEALTQRAGSAEVGVFAALATGNDRLAELAFIVKGAKLDRDRLEAVERRVDALEKRVG